MTFLILTLILCVFVATLLFFIGKSMVELFGWWAGVAFFVGVYVYVWAITKVL